MKVKFQNLIVIIFSVLIFISILSSCDSSEKNRYGIERLGFNVVDSLIGPAVIVESANKTVCPPAGCIPISDSLLKSLKLQKQSVVDGLGEIKLLDMLVDSTDNLGLIVSQIDGLMLSSDTTKFLEQYMGAIQQHFSGENYAATIFVVNDVLVKQYRLIDEQYIRFQLLCLSESNPALEIQYYASKDNYMNLLQRIESSIGTIQLIRKEDKS